MNCINCTDANGDKVLSTSERRFVEVNRSIQNAILGKQVADAIKKAPSTWNEMMSNGKGPVYETCQILRKIEEEGRSSNARPPGKTSWTSFASTVDGWQLSLSCGMNEWIPLPNSSQNYRSLFPNPLTKFARPSTCRATAAIPLPQRNFALLKSG